MDVQQITLDRSEARELYRDYKKHLYYSAPIDDEIRRVYQLIAQGRVVIKALESIRLAGLSAQGYPKLAIARATATACWLFKGSDGRARMCSTSDGLHRGRVSTRDAVDFPAGSFPGTNTHWRAEAKMPLIPIKYRPRRGLANYHVLWEAEWTPIPPRDPYLLRRIGKGDMWLVCAAWDLTEVERAALATRLNG